MSNDIRPTVLVVDDLQDNLDLICEILEDEPYDVLTACDAVAALRIAQDMAPAAAILDVQMPDVDGYELCRQLREVCGPPRIPVLFLTAHCTAPSDVVHGLDTGGCDYITKPFDADVLRARLRATLRARTEQHAEIATAKRIARRLNTG